MTNIIKFPSRHVAPALTKKCNTTKEGVTCKTRRSRKPKATADTLYFITTLHVAANIAAYVYKDKKGVEMILSEITRFYAAGISYDHLPLDVRTHCHLYLNDEENPNYVENMTKAFEFIYR